MVVSFYQNTGQTNTSLIANKYHENKAKLMYLGITVSNQNCIHEEMKSILNWRKVCCRSVQSLFSCRLLSNSIKTKIWKTITLPVVLYICETWSLTLREVTARGCLRTAC
jgi:hypothetical protein